MDFPQYIKVFQTVANQIDNATLSKKQIEVAVGTHENSVFIKLYKKQWANKTPDALTAPSRIFFSVWVTDASIQQQKILYNIHALKLRHLNGYSITSRDFAENFRKKFKPVENEWANVSTKFGPLTLMEGWATADTKSFTAEVLKLANQFFTIEYIIDDLLEEYKNNK